ncbi:MAG: hypothetical protein ACXW31_09960 [Thermoanaerobaculia bacterium]
MASQTSAPKLITWIICLVLFLVAVLAHFGMIRVSNDIATWSWIIGYALLLVAAQIRGL